MPTAFQCLQLLSQTVLKAEIDGLCVNEKTLEFHFVEPQAAGIFLKTESKHAL